MDDGSPNAISPEESSACVHHWLLGDPVAGAVPGRCRRCGQERAFSAHPEGTERFDDHRELVSTALDRLPVRESPDLSL